MGHNHDHGTKDSSNNRLLLVTLLNVFITVAEIIGGLMANSLALLSDAIHNLSDTIAILMTYIARRISTRSSNEQKTFGYKRIEILAAFVNALVLIGISVYLVYEAILRFSDPTPAKGLVMFVVAGAALIFNLLSVLLLKKHSGSSLNIRSAYLHLLGDALFSLAVVIGGVLIYYTNLFWIDPVITLLISIIIIKETWGVFMESIDILMQSTPKGMDMPDIVKSLEGIDGIANIHHVHVWSLSDDDFHFECHADLEKDMEVSHTDEIRNKMEQILLDKFNIGHITVQFEFNTCDNKGVISQG